MGHSRMKIVAFRLLAVLLSVLVLAPLGEVALRCLEAMPSRFRAITLDDTLGWRAAPNISYTGAKRTYPAASARQIHTDSEGFRAHGDPGARDKQKVFFLGDSFTQAVQVCDNETYYAILRETRPIEVFAYGGGGYGTLQESMILERYIDRVKPDVVVLQFCYNDFINNHAALERRAAAATTRCVGRTWCRTAKSCNPCPSPGRGAELRQSIFPYAVLCVQAARPDRLTRVRGGCDRTEGGVGPGVRGIRRDHGQGPGPHEYADERGHAVLSVFGGRQRAVLRRIRRICEREGIVFIDGIAKAIRQAEAKQALSRPPTAGIGARRGTGSPPRSSGKPWRKSDSFRSGISTAVGCGVYRVEKSHRTLSAIGRAWRVRRMPASSASSRPRSTPSAMTPANRSIAS